MAVGLSGNLRDFGIADVFQLIGQQRKTGVLELRSGATRVELVFDQGLVVTAAPAASRSADLDPVADRLVRCGLLTRERADEALALSHASAQSLVRTVVERGWVPADAAEASAELVTRDTIFEVLRWTNGSFDFRAQEVSHDLDRADLLGAEQILMDGLRMVDEWQSFAGQVPSEDVVFQHLAGFDRFADAAGGELGPDEIERAEAVFARIDGRLSARRVIDLARLGTFDGTRALAGLRRAGAIGPVASASRAVRHGDASPGVSARAWLAGALAALLPLAALAGVVWWIAGAASAMAPSGMHIERHTLASLREAHAARALGHALEAYRLSRGRWPERLDELAEAGLVAPDALAAPEGRPYYSVSRERGTIVLAPER